MDHGGGRRRRDGALLGVPTARIAPCAWRTWSRCCDRTHAAGRAHPRVERVGSIPDVAAAVRLVRAKSPAAVVFIDAVHYTPHNPVDVQALDCDFLACSAYKFCGPHLGILYGKYAHLDRLEAYKVRAFDQAAGQMGNRHAELREHRRACAPASPIWQASAAARNRTFAARWPASAPTN